MAGGRPSMYKPVYCDHVIEYGKAGKSLAWIAATINVPRQTIYDWMKAYPEFLDAMNVAREQSQKWWEDFGQANVKLGLHQGTFNSAMWNKNMACRFANDWRERTESTIQGPDGAPVQITTITRKIVDDKK